MTSLYYFDTQGEWPSHDNVRLYGKVTGKQVYTFMSSKDGAKRNYIMVSDLEDQDVVWMEVKEDEKKAFRSAQRREQYLAEVAKSTGVVLLSFDDLDGGHDMDDRVCSLADFIADPGVDIEKEIENKLLIEFLRRCLERLDADERELLERIYLCDAPVTLEEFGSKKGITRQKVHYMKTLVLKKLKNYFENILDKPKKIVQ